MAEERRLEERKRLRRSNSYSDSDATGSEDERPRKSGGVVQYLFSLCSDARQTGRFGYDQWSRADENERRDVRIDDTVTVVEPTLTGDEAYQRRLALTAQRRPPQPTAPLIPNDNDDIAGLSVSNATTILPSTEPGEEAYLRRLAMSKQPQAPTIAPLVSPPSPPPLAYNPFAPPSSIPPPPPVSMPSELEAKVKAAAAIAARLGALAASAPSEPSGSAEEEK